MNDGKHLDAPTPELIAKLATAELTPATGNVLGMAQVRSAMVPSPNGDWFVCRAPQNPGCARLLDVVVKLRAQHDVPCLAVLEPPNSKEGKLGPRAAYLSAYQGAAWHALRVALVLEDGERTFAPVDAAPNVVARAEFEKLVVAIDAALRADASTAREGARWILPEDSREAEALVRLTMNRVLRPMGYKRKVDGGTLGKTYAGFWRRPEADGVWTSDHGQLRHVALESKLDEDAPWPLCQIVDHLAHVTSEGGGGVLHVRVHRAGSVPAAHTPAMRRLEDALLVRYLDVGLQA